MMRSIIQIIVEEVQNFFSDWQMNDEPSVVDKYYEKYHGIDSTNTNKEVENVDAEVVAYVTTDWGGKILETPIPIYKNPKSLEGIGKIARGVLMQNADFYVAKTYYGAHEIILKELAEKNIIPQGLNTDYMHEFPDEFVAVQRNDTTNTFVQSDAYRQFPEKYLQMFNNANSLHPYKFKYLDIID